MKIKELIKRLKELQETSGDVIVEVRNPAGDFSDANDVQIVNVSRKTSEIIWRVYLDT